MAKILLKEPNGPCHANIDTDVMAVEIRKTYVGVTFISDSGKTLSVCERDGGFELTRGEVSTDGT